MTDPNHMHEFDPNRKGKCKQIVSGNICHKPEDAEVHTRYKKRQEEIERSEEREAVRA